MINIKKTPDVLEIKSPVTLEELLKNDFVVTEEDKFYGTMYMKRENTNYLFRYLDESYKNFKMYQGQGWYLVGYDVK